MAELCSHLNVRRSNMTYLMAIGIPLWSRVGIACETSAVDWPLKATVAGMYEVAG